MLTQLKGLHHVTSMASDAQVPTTVSGRYSAALLMECCSRSQRTSPA